MNLAYVFPGQGSQSRGMLHELAERFPFIREPFQVVSNKLGYDVWELVQQDPLSRLNQTQYTQVAMLTADVAVFQLLQQKGMLSAKWMAGHSLGEYAALVCANAIGLEDAAMLVEKRGQLMQDTVPEGQGAMAAIVGLTDQQVHDLCDEASTADAHVMPANYNAIGQVVIAGHAPAVQRAINLAQAHEARLAMLIPVSVPCHCTLLNDAAEAFEAYLARADFKEPDVAVISNVDLSIYQSPEQIRTLLKKQLVKPVRWVEIIQFMQSQGVDHLIESGPGKVLSGLIKRIDKSLQVLCVQDDASLQEALTRYGVTMCDNTL